MDFETLKQSSSNFDALTKALDEKLNPEDKGDKSKYHSQDSTQEWCVDHVDFEALAPRHTQCRGLGMYA